MAEAIPDEADRIAELVRKALATGAVKRVRAAHHAHREVPFALAEQGVILEGFIDLVLETDDGIEIIDWKTDAVSAGGVDRRLETTDCGQACTFSG